MPSTNEVKEKILSTASELFYQNGIRAVGVDLVVEKAGVAKTSLYRHFATKDDLVVAFLEAKDEEFFSKWDVLHTKHENNPQKELFALLDYIAEGASDPTFRGCPQLNIAAEYPDIEHPARKHAKAHKIEMRRRLKAITSKMNCSNPDQIAGQLTILINGAISSTSIYESHKEAKSLLTSAAKALLAAASK